MAKILIIFSTTDGHTKTICQRLEEVLKTHHHDVTLLALKSHGDVNLQPYDKVILGASIRYGKHQQEVFDFIEQNLQVLDSKENAFFTVNIVARKPEKNAPTTNPYMKKFLQQISWQPKHLAVFAGRLDFPRYKWSDRTMIRFIMWMTKGPTAPGTVVEYTDWDSVEAFGHRLGTI